MSVFDILFRLRAENEVSGPVNQAKGSIKGLKTELGGLNRAGAAVGGKFGEIAGKMDALSGAFDSGAGKVALLAGGVLAAGVAVTKFGGFVVDTISNIDDLSDSLSKADQERLKPFIESSEKANKALGRLEEASTELSIVLAGTFSGVVLQAASDLTSFVDNVSLAITSVGDFKTGIVELLEESSGSTGMEAWIDAVTAKLPGLGLMLKSITDEAPKLVDIGTSPGGVTEPGISEPSILDEQSSPLGIFDRPAPKDPPEKARKSPAVQEAEDAADAYKRAADEIKESLADTAAVGEEMWGRGARAAEESAFRAQEAYATQMMNVSDTFGMMSDVVGTVGDAVVDGIKSGGKESKKALRQAAKAAKIFAIFDIQLKGLQSVMASAALGYPQAIPGIIASGVMTTVSTAMAIATPLPSFHTGGLRARGADEQVTPGAITRRGEVPAVITEQGFRSLGGEQGLAALNRGQPQGGVMAPIYLVLEGVTAPLRELARPEPALGQS